MPSSIISRQKKESPTDYAIFRRILLDYLSIVSFLDPKAADSKEASIDLALDDAIENLCLDEEQDPKKLKKIAIKNKWRTRSLAYLTTCHKIGAIILHSPGVEPFLTSVDEMEQLRVEQQELYEKLRELIQDSLDAYAREGGDNNQFTLAKQADTAASTLKRLSDILAQTTKLATTLAPLQQAKEVVDCKNSE